MKKRPQATAIIVTHLATGETLHYSSMREASIKGGFDYQMIQNCVRGLAKSHVGYTFKAAGGLRPVGVLRPRVQELAQYLNQGLTIEQAADKMGLKIGTARHYFRQASCLGVLNA